MRVTTVKATLRYSAEARGAWRSIEVGAEASLTNSEERWEEAQAELYARLGQQLKALWNNGASKESQAEAPPPEEAPKPEHWCEEHQTYFKKRNGQYGEFWSHRLLDGSWCNEKTS